MRGILRSVGLIALLATAAPAAEVSGRIEMPDVCSPGVSPAVVSLEPANGVAAGSREPGRAADVTLVDQHGLQFVPRVQAMPLGQAIRFTNSDTETHSVHVVSQGYDFNQSMPAGQSRDWIPQKAGVVRLVCDIHTHMRGFVVVGDTPWVQACSRQGNFRLSDVPDGRYVLTVWHEMGEPLEREVEVRNGKDVGLGTLSVSASAPVLGTAGTLPVRPWAEIIDRIGMSLAASQEAASRPGELLKARALAESAYWVEFEASDMETAVRTHLGFARKGRIEKQFSTIMAEVVELAQGHLPPSQVTESTGKLLVALNLAQQELNRKGVTDRTRIFQVAGIAPQAVTTGSQREHLSTLKRELGRVREIADQGKAGDAAYAMTVAYFNEFEPIERFVQARNPADVRPLEARFNAVRGQVATGLKGDLLAARFDELFAEIQTTLGRSDAQTAGSFGPAFGASLVTILREGIEVILLLTMLVALVAKTGQARAIAAIRWGVILALGASAVTAWALNRLVSSAQGRAREVVEGLVMLAAAGVLFYVSYWLISKSESKRWMDFLKRQARRGAELGGAGTLALTAFLAVYREGAETALMYQAMIGAQGQSRPGLIGLAVGTGLGLVLLAIAAWAIRATSVRLPLRAFFQVSGIVLFALAVVFAGNGIAELQSSGLLKITPLNGMSWLGSGIPALGLYPTVQTLSVQGVLLVGAGLALALMFTGERTVSPGAADPKLGAPPAAGAGV